VRPLAKTLLKKRDEPKAVAGALPMGGADGMAMPAPVSPEMMGAAGVPLGDRVGLVRDFTRDNPARAALAVRDMIKTEGA
jgi:flagellar M-ring protein FliF